MSYILDALRKADAQRERDPARGIHAQPMAAAGAHGTLHMPAWALAAAAGLLAVVAGVALWEREPLVVAEAAAPVASSAPPPSAAPVSVPAPPVPTVATSVSPPAPPALPREPAAGRTSARTAPPPPMPGTTSAAAPAAAAPAAAAPVTAAPVAAAPVAAPVAAPAADRIFAVAELPAEVQRDLPKLSISGGVHSENAAQRMLIVGGQVLGEGAVVAPGVTLEQIRPHVAVLRFRGYRYSLGY